MNVALPPKRFRQQRSVTRRRRGVLVVHQGGVESATLLEAKAFIELVASGEGIGSGGHWQTQRGASSGKTIERRVGLIVMWVAR